tara:strand:- start:472 stop:606 length:135 start_codon:yes stop_codon:yes gene_type:complete
MQTNTQIENFSRETQDLLKGLVKLQEKLDLNKNSDRESEGEKDE